MLKRIVSCVLMLGILLGMISPIGLIVTKAASSTGNLRVNIGTSPVNKPADFCMFNSLIKGYAEPIIEGNQIPYGVTLSEVNDGRAGDDNTILASIFNLDLGSKTVLNKNLGRYTSVATEKEDLIDKDNKYRVADIFYVKPENGATVSVQYESIDGHEVNNEFKKINISDDKWMQEGIPILGDKGVIKISINDKYITYNYTCADSTIYESLKPIIVRWNAGTRLNLDSISMQEGHKLKMIDGKVYFYDGYSTVVGYNEFEPYSKSYSYDINVIDIDYEGRYVIPVKVDDKYETTVVVYTNNIRPHYSLRNSNVNYKTDYTQATENGVLNFFLNESATFNLVNIANNLSWHKFNVNSNYADYSKYDIKSENEEETWDFSVRNSVNVWSDKDEELKLSDVTGIHITYNNRTPLLKTDDASKTVTIDGRGMRLTTLNVYKGTTNSKIKTINLNAVSASYKYSDLLDKQEDGIYSLEVINESGRVVTARIYLDTVCGKMNFQDGNRYREANTFTFVDSPLSSGFQSIKRDGKEIRPKKDYSNNYKYTEEEEGKHTYTIVDFAGNKQTITVYMDFTAPETGISKDIYFSKSKEFTAKDNSKLESIIVDGETIVGNGTKTSYTVEGYGRHTIKVVDAVGHSSTSYITLCQSIDSVKGKLKLTKKSKKKYELKLHSLTKLKKPAKYEVKITFYSKRGKAGEEALNIASNTDSKTYTFVVHKKAYRIRAGYSRKNLTQWNKNFSAYTKVKVKLRIRVGSHTSKWKKMGTRKLK